MQIGFCTDPATLATLPFRPACDFIEGHVVNFLTPEATDAEFAPRAAALKACGHPMPAANVLLPAALKCSGPSITRGSTATRRRSSAAAARSA